MKLDFKLGFAYLFYILQWLLIALVALFFIVMMWAVLAAVVTPEGWESFKAIGKMVLIIVPAVFLFMYGCDKWGEFAEDQIRYKKLK